jgi:dTDP-4-dehydrorhamnose 3,5-epimerase
LIFTPTPLAGAYLISLEPRTDFRGSYARAYSEEEFSKHGLNTRWRQINHSFSPTPGTLRGMHYQRGAHAEIKLVRCLRGALHDVIIDLRGSSSTRHKWFAVKLKSDEPRWLYVPEGFAHGFLTLCPNVECEYMVSADYAPDAEAGVRYNDPYFNIPWPGDVKLVSAKDQSWADFTLSTGNPFGGTAE